MASTSVPGEFEVVGYIVVDDCVVVEKALHAIFDDLRVDPSREFFQVSEAAALAALGAFGEVLVSEDVPALEDPADNGLDAELEELPATNDNESLDGHQHASQEFIDTHLRQRKGARISASDLRSFYELWCEKQGAEPENNTAFGLRVRRSLPVKKHKSHGSIYYLGLTLVQAA